MTVELKAPPHLRRVEEGDVQEVHAVSEFETGISKDAKLHNIDVLPHHHTLEEIEDFFPVAEVGADIAEYPDYEG